MRVAVLWSKLSGYFNACLQALADRSDALFVSYEQSESSVPFAPEMFAWLDHSYSFLPSPDLDDLLSRLDTFEPTLLLVCGWHIPAYRAVALHYRGRALRVLCMDNQWLARPRQFLGVATAPWFLRPRYDAAFVASPRAALFARRLGFADRRIFEGVYSADTALFDPLDAIDRSQTRGFIQVSRLVPEKGIATLIAAYRRYRAATPEPWGLTLCGNGPEAWRLDGIPGVRNAGFQQPAAVAGELAAAACFVLASHFEPWGVALHEAACAGLPIIATSACGAADGLVQDGTNGFRVRPGSVEALADAMVEITALRTGERQAYGRASHTLSRHYSPSRFAETVARIASGLAVPAGAAR